MQDLRRFPSHNPPLWAWGLWEGILHFSPVSIGSSWDRGLSWGLSLSWSRDLGSDVELEEIESEQTGLAFSLPPSPGCVRANSPVEFLHDFLFPSPGAHDTVSFGLDDILHTAICIKRSPVPGSSHFPPALLMRRPLTSPTLWVLWSLPGGRPEGDGRRDRLDSWSREGATKSHWLGSESHQAHRTCRGALYGGFGGRRTPSVAQFDWDPWERKGVPDGRAHLTIWVIWGGC